MTEDEILGKYSQEVMDRDMKTASVMKQAKIVAICVPARGMIEAGFLNNYVTVLMFFFRQKGCIPLPIFSDGVPLDKARNDLVQAGILAGADYYFFLDSDVYINETNLQIMWDYLHSSPDINMVTGIYFLRDRPYTPVIRMEDENGRMMALPEYEQNKPFEVHGAGMGCFLARKFPIQSVYFATKGRPFQFHTDISEDLFFCKEVRKCLDKKGKPFRIMCHPEATCGHYGAFIHEWHHLQYLHESYIDLAELHAYLRSKDPKITKKEVLHRLYKSPYDIDRKFRERFPSINDVDALTEDEKRVLGPEIDSFYREIDDYLFDLTKFWIEAKKKISEVFARIPKESITFLDYGCGIGDYGLAVLENRGVCHVDFVDINIPNIEYLKWRLDQRRDVLHPEYNRYRVFGDSEEFFKPEHRLRNQEGDILGYDSIFCFEVLEHLVDPVSHLTRLRDLLKKDGILFASVGAMHKGQAQHIASIDITKHGFIRISEYVYVRDDSGVAEQLKTMKV